MHSTTECAKLKTLADVRGDRCLFVVETGWKLSTP